MVPGKQKKYMFRALIVALLLALAFLAAAYAFPAVLVLDIRHEQNRPLPTGLEQFPVTVDPAHKLIVENASVNTILESANSPLQAAAVGASQSFWSLLEKVAITIANEPWYQGLAAAGERFVTVTPGMRKEQVADAFGRALGWNATEKKEFLTPGKYASLPLTEGSFSPGIFLVDADTTPAGAQLLVNDRFTQDVLSHYGTTTAQVVPLSEALTIASLIEREAGSTDDMRLISGIIWNRLFLKMNLQIDATLQYVKAGRLSVASWWPSVVPADKFRASPYNTYAHPGLPPTPIASPSVAAILAALNPRSTSCLFYFHDAAGQIHCSDTYAAHIALLKKYYGQGK